MGGVNTRGFCDSNFDAEVLTSSRPVLVDFWGENCSPCKALRPTIDELADEYAGRVSVGKVNIEQCPSLALRYGITSIPTVIVFQQGEPKERLVGLRPKKTYNALLERLISDASA